MTLDISRKVVLAQYTSYEILSREPSETTWIPTAKKSGDVPARILREDVEPLVNRFVYVFLEQSKAQFLREFHEDVVPDGPGNPLFFRLEVRADGVVAVSTGVNVRKAAESNATPLSIDVGREISFPMSEAGVGLNVYCIVSRVPLSLPSIEELERKRPPHIPLIDLTAWR